MPHVLTPLAHQSTLCVNVDQVYVIPINIAIVQLIYVKHYVQIQKVLKSTIQFANVIPLTVLIVNAFKITNLMFVSQVFVQLMIFFTVSATVMD